MTTTQKLSARLRSETKEAHTAAERSGIMARLLRGEISGEQYLSLLRSLAALYAALETEIERHPIAELSGINLSVLRRLPALVNDIGKLANAFGARNDAGGDVPAAAREYALYLHELGNRSPELLFAHAYLRYLGDMYGGQIMKTILDEALGITALGGATFYEFPLIADLATFKTDFRNAIDAIELTGEGQDRMVQEALRGYQYHAAMFRDLSPAIYAE